MIRKVADVVLPHYCCFCGNIGDILCQNCKNDIMNEPFSACLVCGKLSLDSLSLCAAHKDNMLGASVVGWHEEQLEALIHASKTGSIRRGCVLQAELIGTILPDFIGNTVIVPIPTIRSHIRQRGFDHTKIIARELARERGYMYTAILRRTKNYVQKGSTRRERIKQAALSLTLDGVIDPDTNYIVVDDVYTTGATIGTAVKLLRRAGARRIWVAITARQPDGLVRH